MQNPVGAGVDNFRGGCDGLPTVDGMRSAVAALGLGLALVGAAVSSCSGPGVVVQPPAPDPSSTPVYASEEEALAAAEEAYGAYVDALNSLGQSGWKESAGLSEVARGPALTEQLASATELASKGYRQVGASTFDHVTIQQYDSHHPVLITLYLCIDVSAVDVVDANGRSVVSTERPERQPREVDIDDVDGSLKVSRSDAWSGDDFC